MRELRVTLETVTPLFLSGAEARGQPELRPPAFRGALRYWLRAALGGVIGDDNLDGLHRAESAVFGSTNCGSPIAVRLTGDLETKDAAILPHKGKVKRSAFCEGQSFTLTLSQVRSATPAVWTAATATLALMVALGGVGLRSRRGYGTLRVRASTDTTAVAPTPATLEGWKEHVERVADRAIQAVTALAVSLDIPRVGLKSQPAAFPCATTVGLIHLADVKAATAVAALRTFMEKVPKDKAFGGIEPRQASPLWVRPVQTGEHEYGLLLTVLASRFPGSNYRRVAEFVGGFGGENLNLKGWNV